MSSPTPIAPTVALDQHHWIRLARAGRHPSEDHCYTKILELADNLHQAGVVRFPLTADRYWETWMKGTPRQRIDVAEVMARLSGYETMIDLDTLTVFEIEACVHRLLTGETAALSVEVFGDGINHAWGMESLAETLRIQVTGHSPEVSPHYGAEGVRAVFRETWQTDFEWAALSAHPEVAPMAGPLLLRYRKHRDTFVAEETKRSEMIHREGLDPTKAAYLLAATLHMRQIIVIGEQMGLGHSELPLDEDPIKFLQEIPTIHVLAELLAAQYQNPATRWKDSDYGDLRTACEAVVYCDVVAPDKRWAHAIEASGLHTLYGTRVVRSRDELLKYLEELA